MDNAKKRVRKFDWLGLAYVVVLPLIVCVAMIQMVWKMSEAEVIAITEVDSTFMVYYMSCGMLLMGLVNLIAWAFSLIPLGKSKEK